MGEGEFDALLAWQSARDLCDVASLGGAGRRLAGVDAAPLTHAWSILIAYDGDAAGAAGASVLDLRSRRLTRLSPPAHDLTTYWQEGGDLRAWLAAAVARHMLPLLDTLYTSAAHNERSAELFARWLPLYERALAASAPAANS